MQQLYNPPHIVPVNPDGQLPLHALTLADLLTVTLTEDVFDGVKLKLAPWLILALILGVTLGLSAGAPMLRLTDTLTVTLFVTLGVASALAPILRLTLIVGVILFVKLIDLVGLALPKNIPPKLTELLGEGVTLLVTLTLNNGLDKLTLLVAEGVTLVLGTIVQSCDTEYTLDLHPLTVPWNSMVVPFGIFSMVDPLRLPTPLTICNVGLPENTKS